MSKKVELFRLCKFVGLEFALNPTMGKISRPFFICLLLLSGFSAEASAPYCREVFIPKLLEAANPGMPATPKVPTSTPRLPFSKDIFTENTASRVFVELADRGMLLKQDSVELDAKGLMIPNGGLCASSCMANLVGSMTAQSHNFVRFREMAPHVVELLIEGYNAYTGKDGRIGAEIEKLADVIGFSSPQLLRTFDYQMNNHEMVISARNLREGLFPYRIDREMRGDSIAIATAAPASGAVGTHAVIILKVDIANRLLYISDPNNPNMIVKTPFRYTNETDFVFRLPFTYGDIDVRLYRLSVFSRHIHNFN